uniref:RING-type domain-containing protein n=1 Tax=Globodera pallida TaxID=36090 RepID=A0A183C2B0_GLOPA
MSISTESINGGDITTADQELREIIAKLERYNGKAKKMELIEMKNTKLELENKALRSELEHQKRLNACKCMTIGEMQLNMEDLKQQQNQKEKIGNIPDFVLGCRAKTAELERKQKADQEEHRAQIDETIEAKVVAELDDHLALHTMMEQYQNKQQQSQEDHEKLKNLMEEMNLKQQQHQKENNDKIGWLNEDQQKLVSIDQFSRVQTAISDLKQKQKDGQEELLRLKSLQSMVVLELRQQNMEVQSDQKALLQRLDRLEQTQTAYAEQQKADQKALSATIDQLFNEHEEKLNDILGQFVEEQNKKLEEQKETDRRMLQKKMDELGNSLKTELEKEMNQLKGELSAKMEQYQKQQQLNIHAKMEQYQKQQQLNIHAKMEQYQNKQQQTIVDLQQTVAVLNDKINGKDAHASNNLTTNQFVRIQNAHASNNSTKNQFVGIKQMLCNLANHQCGLRPALKNNKRIPCDYCELIHKKALKVSENFSELFLGFAILIPDQESWKILDWIQQSGL